MNTPPDMKLEEHDVLVLGGGKAGKSLAIDSENRGIKTALIERSSAMIGGSCINVACIPTKTLITERPYGCGSPACR